MSSINISFRDAETTDWVAFGLIAAILLARIGLNVYHSGRPGGTSYLALASLMLFTARVAINHYILGYGTITDYAKKYGYDIEVQPKLQHAQIASQLSLVARFLVTSFYWLQCVLCLLLYRRLVEHIPWVRMTVRLCWTALAVTWVAVTLVTFLECQPFGLYYQLPDSVADTPTCIKAYGQLLTQCISNIVIDILLLIISFPILQAQISNYPRNIQLGVIYILGTFCIIVTCIRISNIYQRGSTQYVRSFWASVQALVATFVANGPPIYAALLVIFGSGMQEKSEENWVVDHPHDDHEKDGWIKGDETIKMKSVVAPEDGPTHLAEGGAGSVSPVAHADHQASGAIQEHEEDAPRHGTDNRI